MNKKDRISHFILQVLKLHNLRNKINTSVKIRQIWSISLCIEQTGVGRYTFHTGSSKDGRLLSQRI